MIEEKKKRNCWAECMHFPQELAIGRLDEDSEELLLLTTDGMMSGKSFALKSRKKIMYDAMVRKPSIK
jgi:16S rRNA U516 pseudouridylate synthase RsuA-like enzyme